MAKFKMEFDMNNDAFADMEYEVCRILQQAKMDFRRGVVTSAIRDSNGNKVGSWTVEPLPTRNSLGV